MLLEEDLSIAAMVTFVLRPILVLDMSGRKETKNQQQDITYILDIIYSPRIPRKQKDVSFFLCG